MLKYLIPRISLVDVPVMLVVALIGALVAGAYGIVHDQITYTISPEYFTQLKFPQFHYADFGWGDRAFAATIGFLASWWVGGVAGWLLARRLLPQQPRRAAYRQLVLGFACVLTMGVIFGGGGYVYGLWRGPDADYSAWQWAVQRLQVQDLWAFVRVAYIHNASYLGGLAGLVIALLTIRPQPANSSSYDVT